MPTRPIGRWLSPWIVPARGYDVVYGPSVYSRLYEEAGIPGRPWPPEPESSPGH